MGLLIAAMLAADMSTDSSYMLTWGGVIYNDLLAPFRRGRWPEARALRWNRFILAGIGVSLRSVVDTAISTPVSLEGVVVMVLLAYTIFTTTLVLQRKQAARGLALGLASLTIPLVPLLALSRLLVEALFVATLGLLLFRGLLRPEVRTYLNEQ
jgi:Na+/proline symporter